MVRKICRNYGKNLLFCKKIAAQAAIFLYNCILTTGTPVFSAYRTVYAAPPLSLMQ